MAASIFNGTAVKILKDILKFKDGTTLSSTVAGYLNTLSSNVQTQIDAKATEKGVVLNYISNFGAEIDTTGWATYADGAVAAPVDGTGGSPTVTLTRSTSSPLRGAASFILTKDAADRQGQGASYAFTIDTADQAKPLQIELSYTIDSGTYSGGTSSTDSDVTCYIYDVTNAVVIQPSGFKLDGAVVGTNYSLKASFQAASNSTSYRLIFHVATTSASAYTLKLDNIVVSPIVTTNGPAMTDWTDFPSVAAGTIITGTTTNPAYGDSGSPTTNKAQWRRVGANMEIRWDYRQVTATSGSNGSGAFLFNLPPGYVIDTTKVKASTTITEVGAWQDSTVGDLNGMYSGAHFTGGVAVYSSTQLKAIQNRVTAASAGSDVWGSAAVAFTTAAMSFSYRASVPIVGWSSNTQVSSDTDTRVVAASVYQSAATFAATTTTPINFDAVEYDTHGAITTSATAWKFTAPVPGIYDVSVFIGCGTVSTTTSIYKNGAAHKFITFTNANFASASGATSLSLNAGDYIDIRPSANRTTTGGALSASGTSTIVISRRSGPSQIASTETIAARIGGDPASAASGAPVIFPTAAYDTHLAYNTTTGRFTCPAPGLYETGGQITSANTAVGLFLYKNAVSDVKVGTTDSNGEAVIFGGIRCVAGDIIDIRPNNTLDADSTSVVYFKRIGN